MFGKCCVSGFLGHSNRTGADMQSRGFHKRCQDIWKINTDARIPESDADISPSLLEAAFFLFVLPSAGTESLERTQQLNPPAKVKLGVEPKKRDAVGSDSAGKVAH